MDIPGFECKQDGLCCGQRRVPVTLVDVQRLAAHLEISPQEVLTEYIECGSAGEERLLFLEKKADGWCRFNTEDNRCGVHPAKPSACVVFVCDPAMKSIRGYPWALMFGNPEGLAFIIERSIAQEVTGQYMEKHGTDWDEADFHDTLEEIEARVAAARHGVMKAARHPENRATFVTFDCGTCHLRASCCADRPLTLEDARVIARHLGLSLEDFFRESVSPTLEAKAEGLLSLERSEAGHCTFLDAERLECAVRGHMPMHCRAMACPLMKLDAETFDRYFLGSGTLEEQYRHSVAVEVTRRYAAECGAAYDPAGIEKYLHVLDRLLADPDEFAAFRQYVAPYRYENEAALRDDPQPGSASES